MAESMVAASPPTFGRAFGETHFMFKPGFVHLNQGELYMATYEDGVDLTKLFN